VRRKLLAGAVAALFALTSCAQPTGSDTAEGGERTTYKIGVLLPRSGTYATVGRQNEAGVELAVGEINSTGFLGEGKTLEVDVQDTGGEPARAIGVANRWTQQSDVLGVACCVFTNEAAAVAPVLPESGMAMVLNGSISKEPLKQPNVFRGFPLVQAGDTEVTQAALKAFSPKTAAVVFTQDNEGMVDAKNNVVGVLEQAGVKVESVGTQAADTSFAGPATQVADAKPDLTVVLLLGNANGQMIKELRDRGHEGPIVADTVASAKDVYNVGGDALVGSLMAIAFDPNSANAPTKNFIERWRAKFPDREPDQVGAIGYMSVWLLARAIKQSGGADRKAVADGLAKVGTVETPMGLLDYSVGQEPKKTDPFSLVQWSAEGGGTIVPWDGTAAGVQSRKASG
jgi:branched-chain amino acid transport system substrate-binding protein